MHWSWLDFNQGKAPVKNIQRDIYAAAHICIQREMARGRAAEREREREKGREGEEDERDKMS